MKIQRSILVTIAAATVSLLAAFPAFAEGARIYGQQPGSRVNVRSAPSTRASAPHYGLVGDYVEVLDSAIGDDGYTWFFVEFPRSGARGWIRGDYIAFP
jgi:Bacterial SH3 domain